MKVLDNDLLGGSIAAPFDIQTLMFNLGSLHNMPPKRSMSLPAPSAKRAAVADYKKLEVIIFTGAYSKDAADWEDIALAAEAVFTHCTTRIMVVRDEVRQFLMESFIVTPLKTSKDNSKQCGWRRMDLECFERT